MIFLRPITGLLAGVPDHIYAKKVDKREIVDRVKEGHPAAQLYGLGAPWTNDHHKKFRQEYTSAGLTLPVLSRTMSSDLDIIRWPAISSA